MAGQSGGAGSGGVGILWVLGIVFVVLKLCHLINWSWWWVTAPFWGGVVLFLALGLILALAFSASVLFGYRKRGK